MLKGHLPEMAPQILGAYHVELVAEEYAGAMMAALKGPPDIITAALLSRDCQPYYRVPYRVNLS